MYRPIHGLTPRLVPPMAVVIPVHPKANSSATMHSSKTPKFPMPPEIYFFISIYHIPFLVTLKLAFQIFYGVMLLYSGWGSWKCLFVNLVAPKKIQ